MSENVYEIVAASAAKWPSAPAVRDEYGVLTFAELHEEVERLRKELQAAGVRKGQGLGIMARNGRQFIIAVFAGLGCEATVMPITHQIKRSELQGLQSEVRLHAILDDGSGIAPLPGAAQEKQLCGFRLAWTGRSLEQQFVPHVSHAAFVRFTSGTTGKSKGVVVSHRAVRERTECAQIALNLNENDCVVWVMPMAYHFIVSIVMYVRYGACIAVCKDILAQNIIDCVEEAGGTVLYGSPLHYQMLAADQSGRRMNSMRLAISTSSGLPRGVAEAFERRFSLPISQIYGIIEVGLPLGNIAECSAAPDAIGRAFPGYEVAILNDQGSEVAAGVIGNLAVRGPGMFDAYLSPARMRDEVLFNGWFMTGDLALRSSDGLVTVAGRRKSVINIAGNKVFPEEVEAILNMHASIQASRVYADKHPLMGEVVSAQLVVKQGHAVDAEEIRLYCTKHLSGFKVPQGVEFVSAIGLTGSGKILRC